MRVRGVVAAGVLLITGCGDVGTQVRVLADASTSDEATPTTPGPLEGRGLLVISDGEARFCQASPPRETLESGAASCLDGVRVTGVGPEALPRPARSDDAVWDLVVVTGELDAIWAVQLAPELEQVRGDRQVRARLPGGVLEVVRGDPSTMTVDVVTTLDDTATRQVLEEAYGDDLVHIEPLFVPTGSLPPVPTSALRLAGDTLAGLPGIPVADVEVSGTVVRTGDRTGLCLGIVLESDPPQCELALPVETLDTSAADVLLDRHQYVEGTLSGDWTGDVFHVTSYAPSARGR